MPHNRAVRRVALFLALLCSGDAICKGGMPALLPTNWTADHDRSPEGYPRANGAAEARWQALSFFTVSVLLAAWGVKGLWNFVRDDFAWMPRLGYGRALGLVVLWGLVFVVVLTMISGARELMTPGAWRKQGWTYTLAEPKPADSSASRAQALERLRFALWNYAATHAGQFPDERDTGIGGELWLVPGASGLRYLYCPGKSVEQAGRLLAFEPEIDGVNRRVLLTNGMIGNMSTAEIERQMDAASTP